MYTQCPDCRTAFRVAADDLRQAAGKVRCGGCGAAFDALLYLSEDLPEPPGETAPEPMLPELQPDSKVERPNLPESVSANESIALLQTLDELAGSDIRIEDTGIEWRVLDEVAMSELDGDAEMTADQSAPDDEIRYDDDSPLPDEYTMSGHAIPDADKDNEAEDGGAAALVDAAPQLVLEDMDAAEVDDSGDWEAILSEFDEQPADNSDDEVGDLEQPEFDDSMALAENKSTVGELNESSRPETPEESSNDASIQVSQGDIGGDIEIVLEGDDAAAGVTEADDGDAPEPETGTTAAGDDSPSQWQLLDEDAQDESIPTLNESQAISSGADVEKYPDDDDLYAEEDIGVESIVMEGDSVRFALDDMEAAASLRAAAASVDFSATHADAPPPKRSEERRGGLLFLTFLLLVALGVQAVHQQRATLARIPAVNDIIGPLYRKVGRPLAPNWDVTGWSFEATTGNADGDDARLNIYTRIGNRSDAPLPYPLIGVSLTDRFEEIIGSRVLEPSGYLANDMSPRKLIAPGESFEAFIAVESPDALASGYKLDVCYRLPDRRLRCAIGDFR